jgi:multiple sugar transport system ATP-binding protein
VSVVESLGSERLVHLVVQGEPVLTDETLEVARDTDDALAQTLTQDADDHEVPVVARMDLQTAMRAGQACEVALDPAFLHFFDLQDGHSIR